LTRVLFLAESFHPVLGGGETHVRRLGRQLVAMGVGATVLTRRADSQWPSREEIDGVRVIRVPPSGPGRTGKYLMVPAALAALFHEGPAHDVIVVRGTRVLGVPGLLAARATDRPVVLQPEVNGELRGEALTWGWRRGRLLEPLVRWLVTLRNVWLRDGDAFVAMSRAIRDEMVGAGVAAGQVRLIPHGVDTERFRPARGDERDALRQARGLPEGTLVLYTGRLLRGKGLETLLQAFAEAAEGAPEARLVLVGSGDGQALSVEDELRAEARRRGLGDRVVFTGRVDDVESFLRAADLFAFPSVYEALGISLLEAAACGLPAGASRTGGIVDVVEDGRSGILVPPGEPGPLARGLASLLRSPERREEMGARARQIVLDRFDERDSALRYRALFGELSSRGGHQPSS
jgi:glycosyltransferase involved in cell wall biosynthesis